MVSWVPDGIVMGGGGGGATGAAGAGAGAAVEAEGCEEAAPEPEFEADDEVSAGAFELLDAGAGVDDLLHPPIVSTTAMARNRAMKGVRIGRLL
jgi:hypothetical protein